MLIDPIIRTEKLAHFRSLLCQGDSQMDEREGESERDVLSASKSHPKLNLISTVPSGKTAVRKANAFCDH